MEALNLLARLGRVESPDPDTLRAVREIVSAAESELNRARRRRERKPRVRHRWASVGIGVAVGLVMSIFVIAGPGTDSPTASAAPFLRQVAHSAAVLPGGWPDARYWYTESEYWQTDEFGTRTAINTRKIWIGRDGTGLIEDPAVGGTLNLTGHDDAVDPVLSTSGFGGYGLNWSWSYLYKVSTDPSALSEMLRTAVTPFAKVNHISRNPLVFDAVASLLTESPAPPRLRASLYRVASTLPGVRLAGEAADSLGRRGTAVEYPATNGWGYTRLIIAPSTGQLLEEENLAPRPGNKLPVVTYISTFVTEGPAPAAGQVPSD